MADNPWRMTDDERDRGRRYLAEFAAAMVFGPVGPFVVLAARYLYDRRDQIFTAGGAPVRAFDATDRAVAWKALATPAVGSGTLTLRPTLSESARRLGVRQGDPVGLVLTGHSYTVARSGLVVPARIGEAVDVTVPRGQYSLGAFAGRQDRLFAVPQPFQAVAGRNVLVGGRSTVALSLTSPVITPSPVVRSSGLVMCPRCRLLHSTALVHRCQAPKPAVRPVVARPVIRPVVARPPAPTCWWCGYADPHCYCLVGGVRRFFDDL